MPVARSRELIVPVGAIALVAALTAIGALLSPPGASGLPPGSSFSKDPDGSAAAYLTLQALGYDIRRSFDPLPSLSLSPAATVLVLADPRDPASEQDRRMLQRFVAAGGRLLVTGTKGARYTCHCPAGLTVVSTGPHSYLCQRKTTVGITCTGGTVRNGQCLCPSTMQKTQAGANAWRCQRRGTSVGPKSRPQ